MTSAARRPPQPAPLPALAAPRVGQHGAALLSAMITVTLVASFAATALWQQWRNLEVEAAERDRVQSAWILTGCLDWARLILREDARTGGPDHLSEPWAIPLNEARLSSFLAVDKNTDDAGPEAFLSGQISDLQGRLNIANLVEGDHISDTAMASFGRLFEHLNLPLESLNALAGQLLKASQGTAQTLPTAAALMPQGVEQLPWLGLSPGMLAVLRPHITLLPLHTSVNLNTASAEVIYASTPGLEMGDAQKLTAARELRPFRSLADARLPISGSAGQFREDQHGVSSRFFEVRGRLRLEHATVQERSVLQRDGTAVRTLWRDRAVLVEDPNGSRPMAEIDSRLTRPGLQQGQAMPVINCRAC